MIFMTDDSIRPITKIVKFGAIAMIPLPMIKVNNVHNKTGRTANRFVNLTKIECTNCKC